MKISVLLPTRGRPGKLRLSIDSLWQKCHDKDNLEFCLKVDNDDLGTIAFIVERYGPCKEMGNKVKLAISDRKGGYRDLARYYEECAALATGDWYLMWNDDAVMLTEGWDRIFRERARRLPNQLFMVVPKIVGHHGGPQLFFLNRQVPEILGGMGPLPHYDDWFASVLGACGQVDYVNVLLTHDEVPDNVRKERDGDSVMLPVAVARERLQAAGKLLDRLERLPNSMDRLIASIGVTHG